MSARALAAQRKKLSTPITKACDENKALLAAAIDKKEYSRSLLVDDEPGLLIMIPLDLPEMTSATNRLKFDSQEEEQINRRQWTSSSTKREVEGPNCSVLLVRPLLLSRWVLLLQSTCLLIVVVRRLLGAYLPRKKVLNLRIAPPKSRPALVPQIKSLTAMEKEGSVFRCFKTRSGLILPELTSGVLQFANAICFMRITHLGRNSELNDMIEHYEGLLLSQQQEIELWRGKFTALESDLQSSSGSKQQLEDQVDGLKSELETVGVESQKRGKGTRDGVDSRGHPVYSNREGSSETEGIVSPEVPAAPKVTSGDVCTEGNEQGISSDQVPAKEMGENPPTEMEAEVSVDPKMENATVVPTDPGSPLFLSGDGFEPAGVLFPHAVFHFPSREKKEAYDFMDKVVDKHRRLCDERQRLGLKRQTLEARIARVERKVRALESDPFQWEWRNFDCIAEIPRMLRMYLRAKGQVQGPVNAPTEAALVDSEEEDEENDDNPWERVPNEPEVEGKNGMEFNLRCSESMPDFSRIGMINEDVPNEPNRRSSPPRGFFRSQIRAPCALIKDLPIRDQGTAMAFIEALALQHRKLTLEKKRLRKRINRMQRRLTTVSRDLHILGSHPGDWIELGISDFARIPDCMMPVLDLAGQGVQVFCSPGGFS
ncbi:hypothetical protein ISN45_Aa07g033480 [Arabidopsis thaliana x Arabidopsis arenosa]|uniref:Uncharacterized protein n=1 Tax=Arabidopsis thaliana x Arabidopsis arenosa TaxID=1240361 RepID=A0A8T1YCK5_9BRAS|nr:hypothetical protein ISN45_Aa07g033480 [Arabidopsis thaliana x Arabidopsis arenosa]